MYSRTGTLNPQSLPEDWRKWTDCQREKPEFRLMPQVGSKVSDFDSGISLRKPFSLLLLNVRKVLRR